MMASILSGAAAGAAGTTVLDAVGYADMAWRGRSASSTPGEVVERLARHAGRRVPGDRAVRDNRLSGLGALSGIAVGSGVGAALAFGRRIGLRPPLLLGGALAGALAMAATDLPIARLGVSDPRTWSRADWLSDAVPHLAYGLATYATLTALDRRVR